MESVAAVLRIAVWFCAIGCGLMAGVYFAFSTFIMTALARIEPAAGAAAMNSINAVILKSKFMPLFLATSLASAGLAVVGIVMGSPWFLAAGALYFIGNFVVTLRYNVPLNNALQSSPDPATWRDYVVRWTRWNTVRMVVSLLTSIAFTASLQAPAS